MTLVHLRPSLRVEKILWRRLFRLAEEGKLAIAWSSTVHAILGGMGVKGLWIVDTLSGLQCGLSVQGVFVAMGHLPNTDTLGDPIAMREGCIQVKGGASRGATGTKNPGAFAAGDLADQVYRQAIRSAGSGCMAARAAEKFLEEVTTC